MEKKRALSLDLARGSMLLLIILAHVPFMLYLNEPGVITKLDPENILEKGLNALMVIFVDDRARPLFAILFGYGLWMIYRKQTERKDEREAKRLIKRRCWYLILFGAVLAGVFGGQDVLMAYGIAGLVLMPFFGRKNKTLIIWSVVTAVIYTFIVCLVWGVALFGIESYGLPMELTGDETYLNTIGERLIGVPFVVIITHLLYPVIPSILMGFWFGQLDVLIQPEKNLAFLKKLMVIGGVISVLGSVPLLLINEIWFPPYFIAGVINGIHVMTGLFGGLFYVGLFGILGYTIINPGTFTQMIAAVGKRSLTFFCAYEIFIVVFLSPIAFNLGAYLSITTGFLFSLALWGAGLVSAYMLETRNMQGPLEWLMRRLVYKSNG